MNWEVETIYPKVPNYFHQKRKTFGTGFIDFEVRCRNLKGNGVKLEEEVLNGISFLRFFGTGGKKNLALTAINLQSKLMLTVNDYG